MEKDRHMEAYQCRLTRKMKRLLFQQAASEFRTANKVIIDALYIYFGMDEKQRKEFKKAGIRAVDVRIENGVYSSLDTMSTTRKNENS